MRYTIAIFLSLIIIFGTEATLSSQYPSKPNVVIYTIPGCLGCNMVKSMFKDRNIAYKEIDLTGKPVVYQEMIRKAGGSTTVPQVFINDKHIGGYSDVSSADLDALVAKQSNQPKR